jgi:DNA repair protein RadC
MTTYKIQPVRCKLVRDGVAISSPVESVSSGEAAIEFFRAYYRREALPNERVLALLLNNRNQIIGLARVSEGGIHGAALTPADVLRPAIAAGARAVILAHNHPSGDPTPSPEDVVMTRNVYEACEVVGVPLLDHVIIATGGRATSMLEQGLL